MPSNLITSRLRALVITGALEEAAQLVHGEHDQAFKQLWRKILEEVPDLSPEAIAFCQLQHLARHLPTHPVSELNPYFGMGWLEKDNIHLVEFLTGPAVTSPSLGVMLVKLRLKAFDGAKLELSLTETRLSLDSFMSDLNEESPPRNFIADIGGVLSIPNRSVILITNPNSAQYTKSEIVIPNK